MHMLKLALRNLSRNSRLYAAYFFSLVANATVYYLFCSVRGNDTVTSVAAAKASFVDAFSISSIVIAVLAGVFMWYSVSFLQRRRGREFGLYALFGLSRGRIGALVVVENIVLGGLALLAGLLLGIVFSKLFFMGLLALLDIRIETGILVEPHAVMQTIGLFTALTVVSAIASLTVLFRVRIVDLFRSVQRSEPRLKPRPVLAFGFALFLIVTYVYALSTNIQTLAVNFLVVSTATIVGTLGFLVFFLPALVERLRGNPRFAWKNGRLLALGHLAHRIKKNVASFFVIAIASTVAIVAFGAVLNFRVNNGEKADRAFPASISYEYSDGETDARVNGVLARHPEHKVLADWRLEGVPVRVDFGFSKKSVSETSKVVSFADYARLYKMRIGSEPDTAVSQNTLYVPLHLSDRDYSDSTATISPDVGPDASEALAAGILFDQVRLLPWSPDPQPVLVVPDEIFRRLKNANPSQLVSDRNILVADEFHTEALDAELAAVLGTKNRLTTRQQELGPVFQLLNLFLFIGIFVCLVFVSSVASIIHFKTLMDAQEDRVRYGIAKALGIDSRSARGAIALQVVPVYLIPAALFSVNGAVALITMTRAFDFHLLSPVFATLGGFIVVFGLFCLGSVRAYRTELRL